MEPLEKPDWVKKIDARRDEVRQFDENLKNPKKFYEKLYKCLCG